MKHLTLFLLFLCTNAFPQAFDQDIVSKSVKDKIKKNNIRFIIGWAYDYNNNVQSRQGKKSSFEKFDKEGNLIEEIYYNVAGGVNYECTREYNVYGMETGRIFVSARQYNTRRWVYKQNSESGELERWPYHTYGSQEHTAYLYDKEFKKVQETRYDRDGLVSTMFYKYDDKGNVIEKLELDGNNNLYLKKIYKYDEQNNCINVDEFDAENKLFMTYTFEYDMNGNKTSELTMDANGNKKQKIKFIYQPYTW